MRVGWCGVVCAVCGGLRGLCLCCECSLVFEVHDDFVFSTFKVVLTHLSQTVLHGICPCVCVKHPACSWGVARAKPGVHRCIMADEHCLGKSSVFE